MRINVNGTIRTHLKTRQYYDNPPVTTTTTAAFSEEITAPTKTLVNEDNGAANYLLKSDLSQDLQLALNSSTIFRKRGDDHISVVDDEESNNTVMVVISVLGIVLIVLGMFCLLCYREIARRRLENGILVERARKEMLRNYIKSKVEEMKNTEKGDDTESYMAVMELKVPLVTFGKVTMISPVPSTESMQSVLDRHLHRSPPPPPPQHHHHHHHHHHHYHKLDKMDLEDDNPIMPSITVTTYNE